MMNRKTYTGEKFGYLQVLAEMDCIDDNGKKVSECYCYCSACGRIITMSRNSVKIAKSHAVAEGKMPSCGCMKYSGFDKARNDTLKDLTGQRFWNLLVVGPGPVITVGKDSKKRRTWQCICDCGRITSATTGDLTSGNTKSCGCLISTGQKQIIDILIKKNIQFEIEYSYVDLLSPNGFPLRFDFAIYTDDGDMILLEYQGIQHYTTGDSWFGKFEREVTDNLKRQYCHERGIKLFEIAYYEDIESKLESILQLCHDNTVPSTSNEVKV